MPEPQNFVAIEQYLDQTPDSPWRLALRLNLGSLYYGAGYYSRAIDAFDAAWHQEGKNPSAQTLPLRDAAIGALAQMHARLGHIEALQAIFAEIGERPLYGAAAEQVAGAREGLWHMLHDHGVAYRCGPAALTSIVESARQGFGATTPAISKVDNNALALLKGYPSSENGIAMDEVVALADKTGMGLVPARREGDAEIPLPAVVHWKVSHYAAIVDKRDGLYHVVDPTFGRDQWLSQDAMDAESSGMFLVPKSEAQRVGWKQVAKAETKGYYGRGYLTSMDQSDTRSDAPTTCPAAGDGTGMCVAKITTMLVSLRLDDKPVGYAPPVGPSVYSIVSYNQRDISQPASMGYYNIGPQWTLNWLAYIEDRPGSPGSSVVRHAGGGGQLGYSGYSSSTQSFTRELRTGATLVMVSSSPVSYERRFADGSKEVYAASDGATGYPRRIFLSQIVDAQGNALTLDYDSSMRLVDVRDALGQATTFAYNEAGNPLLVSAITDPFGRSATFAYDAQGRLASITDAMGMVSAFTYDGTSTYLSQLATPYGTSSFAATTTGTSRSLQITDPLGNVNRTEFIADASSYGVSTTDTPPSGLGFISTYMQYRNTFFWDGEAFARAPGNYQMAKVHHWLHNGSIIPAVLESTKEPLESRVWQLREGQTGSIYLDGSLREQPSVVARRLPDGSNQIQRYGYTASGNISGTTDPLDRQVANTYDTTGTDLLAAVRKTAGGGETLAAYTYNAQHRPLTYTDQAGRTWTLTYNARGQVLTITDPKSQTTSHTYDDNGYLRQVVNANGKVAASYTYDAVGRVASATDSEGHTLGYTYDNLDRLLTTTYPDGTTTANTWTNLDITAVKDRLGRITRYDYDANRKLTAVTDPVGNVTRYGYDRANRLTRLTDANGNATQWERDIQGRVTAKVFPDATRVTYTYDSAGRLASQTDALGQVKQYAYAKDDRPLGVSYVNVINPTPSVSYTWDAYFPRMIGVVDGIGTTSYSYVPTGSDGAGQLLQEQTPQGAIDYVHDELGRLAGRSVNGSDEAYAYDALGRVVGEGNALGNFETRYLGQAGQLTGESLQGVPFRLDVGYESNNGDRRLKALTYTGSRQEQRFHYVTDDADRLLQAEESARDALPWFGHGQPSRPWLDKSAQPHGPVLGHLPWPYGPIFMPSAKSKSAGAQSKASVAGNASATDGTKGGFGSKPSQGGTHWGLFGWVASWFGGSQNGRMRDYRYDAADRLLQVDGDGVYRETYSLDAAGNLLGQVIRDQSGVARKSANIWQWNAQVNENNQIVRADASTWQYDEVGNLLDDGQRSYQWDAQNRLIQIVDVQTGAITDFAYDGLDRRVLVSERSDANATPVVTRYLWCDDEICQQLDEQGNVAAAYFGQGEVHGDTALLYQRDRLGSIRGVVDAQSGQVQGGLSYTAYGQADQVDGTLPDKRYAGMLFHEQSGLYLTKYRAYDPQVGRWLSRDPIGESGGINLYAYVGGDPISMRDPSGLWAGIDDAIFAGGGALVGLAGQGISDLISGQASGWEKYTAAAIGGALGGETLLYTGNPLLAGGVGGASTNVIGQGLEMATGKRACFNWNTLVVDSGVGTLTGLIPGAGKVIPGFGGRNGLSAVTKSTLTKLRNGSIQNVSAKTVLKMTGTNIIDNFPGAGAGGVAAVPSGEYLDNQSACECN